MKIVIASESYPPNYSGVATMAHFLATSYVSQGHEVFVLTPGWKTRTTIERKDGLTICRVRSLPNPFRKGTRLTLSPSGPVGAFMKSAKPDIVHLHDPAIVSTSVRKYANKHGIPVVVTHHFQLSFVMSYFRYVNLLSPLFQKTIKKMVVRFYNQCQLITSPSERTCVELKNWGVNTKIKFVSNGVDYDRFATEQDVSTVYEKFNLSKERPLIIYAGRLDADKRVDLLLSAVKQSLESIDFTLLIVGAGSQTEQLKALAAKLNISKNVVWAGWQKNSLPIYPKFFRAAKFFVSASPIETQSIVMMEAMAAGLPIIGSNAGGTPELVEDGTSGFLIEPGDEKMLTLKIVELLKDCDLQQKMGQVSQQKMKTNDIKKVPGTFLDLYEEILVRNSK